MPTRAEMGARLREARWQRGLSQFELGIAADLNHHSISRYENGITDPGAGALRRLCVALNVSADWVLGIGMLGG